MERNSPIAGTWYEGTEKSLKNQINSLLKDKKFGPGKDPLEHERGDKTASNIIGIISPHAGYVYSGSVASCGFSKIYDNFDKIDTAIVLGPNHRGFGPPISIFPEGQWNFPLGSLTIDEDLVEFARNWDFGKIKDYVQIEVSAHQEEHSLDIQVPFVQYLFGNNVKLFAICFADQSLDPVADVISDFLHDILNKFTTKKIVIIASTDFSHEYDYDVLLKNDQSMIDLFEKMKIEEADQFRKSNRMTMCGYGPVYSILRLAEKIGNPSIETLKYANSAQIKDSYGGYTVGYTSMLVQARPSYE
ncbi:MAG: AmmeMemoRadiSam system protein B [Candidatus Kariarchaeaceae archaeon]|jgi:AmmeMemoRadiSam system protein B